MRGGGMAGVQWNCVKGKYTVVQAAGREGNGAARTGENTRVYSTSNMKPGHSEAGMHAEKGSTGRTSRKV